MVHFAGTRPMNYLREAKKNDASMFVRTTTLREDYREPYWENGEWVFDRYNYTTTTTTTLVPPTTTTEAVADDSGISEELDPDTIALFAEETTPTTTTRTTDAMDYIKYHTNSTHKQCNVICLRIYIRYGEVCATLIQPSFRPESWQYVYRTFENICALERENCMNHTSRPEWRLRHPGKCEYKFTKSTYAEFTLFPTGYSGLLSRAAYLGGRNFSHLGTQMRMIGRVMDVTANGWYWLKNCWFGRDPYKC